MSRRTLQRDQNGGIIGTVYVLHFDRPYKHAGHYIGFALDLNARLQEHALGHGARLTQVCIQNGISWEVSLAIPGTRSDERRFKNRHNGKSICPLCKKHRQKNRRGAA